MKTLLTAIALALAAAGAAAEDQQSSEPLPAAPATRMDTKAMLRFIREAAGKFVQDLRSPGPTKGARIVTRATYQNWNFSALQYDPEHQVYSFAGDVISPTDLELYRACRPAGSYVGQNAFGVRTRVSRHYCELAFLEQKDHAGMKFEGEIPLTREQFRSVQKTGVPLEVEFTLSANGANEAVTKDDTVTAPTIHSPDEFTGPRWTIYGNVLEVRMLLPGGRVQTVYKKQCSTLYPEENDESMGCPKLR